MREKLAKRQRFDAIVAFAEERFGIVTTEQAVEAGANRSWLTRQVQARRLHRLHTGVYSIVVPSLLGTEGRWLAAVLACGDGAALSHRAAAALWDLMTVPSGAIDVTVPGTSGRARREGLRVHRSSTLTDDDVTVVRGIPVTDARRTVDDLRRVLPPRLMPNILRRAAKRQLDIGPQPEHLGDPDRSELERRFAALCRRHAIPAPRTQQVIGPYTVDFIWQEARVIVEVDGWEGHGDRQAFEADRARDAWLTAQGYRVLRFTWRQVTREGPRVAQVVRATLGL